MGKVKLPDDINDWEKRSLREDIGTSEEHKHTIYVYKDFAIEHEEDACCNNWNPYVIVNGHPLKLHEGYFHNFDEALGYLKGAIKEKELVDFDDSPDEPEFPKAKTEDMHKGIQLPTAREMFAEAHCLPDADALRQSYKEHRSQMYDMLFNARKAEDEDNDSEGGKEEAGQPKKQLVQSDIFQYGVGGAPGAKKNPTYGKGEYREGDAPTFKQPTFNTYKEGFKLQTPYIVDGQVKHKTSTIPFTGSRLVQPEPEEVSTPTIPVETSFGTATVAQPTGLPTSGYEREGRMGFKTAKKFGEETDSLKSPEAEEREKKVRQTKGDTSFKTQSRTFNPEATVARKIRRSRVDSVKDILNKEESASRAGAKQDILNIRAQEATEGGKPVTKMPEFKGLSSVGTFNNGDEDFPMISSGSNYGRTFFSGVPKAGGPRKGIYAAIDAHNAMVDLMDPNDPRIVQGMIHKFSDDLGELTPAQVRNLFINNYRIMDPTTGVFTARPEYSEQLDYLGGIDFTQNLFNSDGSLNGRAWSAIQRGDKGPVQPGWTRLNYTDVSANPDKPNPYLHITGTGGWSPHDTVNSDYRIVRDMFNNVRNSPMQVRRFLNSGITLKQLNELKKEFSPAELSRMMGYNFYGQEKPPVEQTGVEVEDRIVPEENRTTLDFTPETSGQDAAVSKKEKGLVAQASAWADVVRNAEETGEWDSDELMAASTGLQELVTKNPQFVLKYPDLFYEEQVQEAIHALQEQVHEFTEEQQIENLLNNMSTTERLDFIKNDLGIDDYKERNGVAHAFWKNATKQQARLILQKLREWYEMQGLDADQVSSKYYDLNASMRGENMDDVMKAKQSGLGDFKDTPESEKKEHKPTPKKEGPKIADISGYEDDPEGGSAPAEPELRRRQSELDVGFAKEAPAGLDSANTWSENPTAPTAQVKLDQVEDRVVPEAPSPQMTFDQEWASTAPGYDPAAKIKQYGVQVFGSMLMDDWIKALAMTDPNSPQHKVMADAIQYRLARDGSLSPMEKNIFTTRFKNHLVNKGPLAKSFREEMEKSISDKDAAAGIPTGFMGTHPMTSPYKRVELGYGKDATYPFVLRNALTGEKVCDVTDNPRENSN